MEPVQLKHRGRPVQEGSFDAHGPQPFDSTEYPRTVETRPLRDARDVEGVVEIINAVYPDDPIGAVDFVSWGEQALERLDLVAERDGAIVGGSRTYLESQRPNPWVHIWVPPEERRHGIGSALFAEISRWASERGHSAFEAWVRADSGASLAFASGLGFRETGREPGSCST